MKVNKAGQKVSTNYISKIRGPLAADLQRSAAWVNKTRWLQQIVYIGRRSRSIKEKEKKTLENLKSEWFLFWQIFRAVKTFDTCATGRGLLSLIGQTKSKRRKHFFNDLAWKKLENRQGKFFQRPRSPAWILVHESTLAQEPLDKRYQLIALH